MELRLGYYPVLDAALALRQIYDSVRFQPYNSVMESLAARFSAEERASVEALGETTDGWLKVIEALLRPGAEGLLGAEEGVLRLQDAAEEGTPLAAARPLLTRALRTVIAPEASRRTRGLLDAASALQRGIQAHGVWDHVLSLSDRVSRARNGDYVFRTKPEMRIREADVERIVLTPSLAASRRLTFWRRDGTVLFYVSGGAEPAPEEPSDGLLLSALAVGDRTRLRMLRRLAMRACSNLEMAEYLGVNPSTASRHFKLFKDAGFVELREEGGRVEYELAPEALSAAFGAILAYVKGGAG